MAAGSAIPESDQAKSTPPPLKCKGETRTPPGTAVSETWTPGGLDGKLKTPLESTKKCC